MRQETVLRETHRFLKKKLSGEGTGHDYWHSLRVLKAAETIARKEKADLFIVRLAALLHDIADWKFHGGDTGKGPRVADRFLKRLHVAPDVRRQVSDIIAAISFKGAGVVNPAMTIEGRVVQDADRLDALGAIGIARAFAYGGLRGREIYNPGKRPEKHATFAAYRKSRGTTVNHFYEKLLLLKDRMNTKTGKQMAASRHLFMEKYLKQFFQEWQMERGKRNPEAWFQTER